MPTSHLFFLSAFVFLGTLCLTLLHRRVIFGSFAFFLCFLCRGKRLLRQRLLLGFAEQARQLPVTDGHILVTRKTLIPDSFRKDILKETEDTNGVLVEDSTVEPEHFALLFEFSGDKKKIRHCMYYCTAARPTIEGKTNEDSKEVQTESLEITATPLPSGLVKVKTGANTTDEVYNGWYSAVYQSPTTEPTEQGQG